MQSRLRSLLETFSNQVLGFVLSVAVYAAVFPILGIQTSLTTNMGLTALFTVLSIVRSYGVRRFFNALDRKP